MTTATEIVKQLLDFCDKAGFRYEAVIAEIDRQKEERRTSRVLTERDITEIQNSAEFIIDGCKAFGYSPTSFAATVKSRFNRVRDKRSFPPVTFKPLSDTDFLESHLQVAAEKLMWGCDENGICPDVLISGLLPRVKELICNPSDALIEAAKDFAEHLYQVCLEDAQKPTVFFRDLKKRFNQKVVNRLRGEESLVAEVENKLMDDLATGLEQVRLAGGYDSTTFILTVREYFLAQKVALIADPQSAPLLPVDPQSAVRYSGRRKASKPNKCAPGYF